MNPSIFVLDTNILVSFIAKSDFERFYKENYLLKYKGSRFIISTVTEGELKAIATKRKWGSKKWRTLQDTLSNYMIYPIKINAIIDAYAQLDAYSQNKLDHNPLPNGMTARNMGKNDLWIAATAYTLGATLVTTDKDFDHLDQVYFQRDYINIGAFR